VRLALNGLFLGLNVGTGRYTRELVQGGARLEASGASTLDWRIIALAGQEGPPLSPHPRRFESTSLRRPAGLRGENPIKLWFEQSGVPRATRRLAVDLLHYPYFAAPLRSPVPLVVTIHDLIPLVLPEYRGSAAVRAYMRLQAATTRRAALILTDSNASRHDIVRYLNVPRQKVRVVPLGVDPRFHPVNPESAAAVRAKHRLPERFVFHSAGLDVRKNVERLILAYARARASHGVTEALAITGNPDRAGGVYRPLRPLVEQLGLEKQVRFLGTVPEEDLPALYGACTLAVCASRYEGFGLPVLEAMASGAVVASSNASSLPEVTGDDALLFDPEDEAACAEAIARGLQDESLRRDLRERGLVRAATFTWEKTAAATLQAYEAALGAQP
jgi:glycosyltransferase involved in cell wall biosynthesis